MSGEINERQDQNMLEAYMQRHPNIDLAEAEAGVKVNIKWGLYGEYTITGHPWWWPFWPFSFRRIPLRVPGEALPVELLALGLIAELHETRRKLAKDDGSLR